MGGACTCRAAMAEAADADATTSEASTSTEAQDVFQDADGGQTHLRNMPGNGRIGKDDVYSGSKGRGS